MSLRDLILVAQKDPEKLKELFKLHNLRIQHDFITLLKYSPPEIYEDKECLQKISRDFLSYLKGIQNSLKKTGFLAFTWHYFLKATSAIKIQFT